MTIADHLRAVLGVLDTSAYRSPADQRVIDLARDALELHGTGTTVVYGDSFADDTPRMRQRKVASLLAEDRRLALHQALIAQDVASVPQERAKSECAPPPGVTQERAATGTVERSTACDIVAQSLVRARETQKLALSTYGREAQQDRAIEECAELIVALRHYQRGTGSLGELQGEIADVLVTVTTLAIQYGDEQIAAAVDYKLARLRKRLGGR